MARSPGRKRTLVAVAFRGFAKVPGRVDRSSTKCTFRKVRAGNRVPGLLHNLSPKLAGAKTKTHLQFRAVGFLSRMKREERKKRARDRNRKFWNTKDPLLAWNHFQCQPHQAAITTYVSRVCWHPKLYKVLPRAMISVLWSQTDTTCAECMSDYA